MRISDWSSDVCSSDLAGGADPARVVIAGDSAGGGLTLATLVALRDAGDPLPAAGVCLSPWADLTQSGATMAEKADVDPMVHAEDLDRWAAAYAGGADPASPPIRPVFADQIGRASCRDRGCQSVAISVVAVSLKKNNKQVPK